MIRESETLRNLLNHEAKCNSGVGPCLSNYEIGFAEVEISQATLLTNKIGQKTSRKETAQPPKSVIPAKKLFVEAKKLATKRNSPKRSFADEHHIKSIEKYGNIVSIVGQAGIGKTTLSKYLLNLVTSASLFDADYIFYLQFRDIDFEEKTNFFRFLTKKITPFWMKEQNIREGVLNELAQSDRVCIIMDGFDEAKFQYNIQSSKAVYHCDEATAEEFIRNIFCGNLFPKAKKLITSRPHQLYCLPQELRPQFVVTILGWNENIQEQICENLCETNKNFVLNYIKSHPDVLSFCFVPVNCIMVMRCINVLSQDDKTNCLLPLTLTSVLIVALCLFSESPQVEKHFVFDYRSLKVFAKLAQKVYSKKKSFFDEDELTNDLKKDQLTTFFVTVPGKNKLQSSFDGRSPKYTCFSHILWQDLFAAIQLMVFEDLTDFNKMMNYKDFTSNHFENVSMFVFGLCNAITNEYLVEKFPQISRKLTEQVEQLQIMIMLHLPDLDVLKKESFQEFIRICGWVNELHDDVFANKFAEEINRDFFINEGEMFPRDVVGFHYVLRNRSSPLSISIGSKPMNFIFDGDSCTRFLKELPKTIESKKSFMMRKLNISCNRIGDDGARNLSPCVSRIEELDVRDCGFTAEGIKMLASKMKDLQNPMRKLNISCNRIGDDGARNLSPCISRIEELDVRDCDFTAEGIKVLASKIKDLQNPMRKLNISCNRIGDDGARNLSPCVSRIEELDVRDCGFTAEGIKMLASKMKDLQNPMRKLNISCNRIGDDGARNLSPCISRIEELDVRDCDFTAEGIKVLASKIKDLQNPMRKLNISCNRIGDDGARNLSPCISRIEELDVRDCDFTAEGIKVLASKIKDLQNPMRKLNISCNRIGDDGARNLSPCISRIEELDVRDCGFTAEGIEVLASKIKE